MGIKRFLLFTATSDEARKQYVASFDTREAAISVAEQLKVNGQMRWELVDSESSKVVAEHRANEASAASSAP